MGSHESFSSVPLFLRSDLVGVGKVLVWSKSRSSTRKASSRDALKALLQMWTVHVCTCKEEDDQGMCMYPTPACGQYLAYVNNCQSLINQSHATPKRTTRCLHSHNRSTAASLYVCEADLPWICHAKSSPSRATHATHPGSVRCSSSPTPRCADWSCGKSRVRCSKPPKQHVTIPSRSP